MGGIAFGKVCPQEFSRFLFALFLFFRVLFSAQTEQTERLEEVCMCECVCV